MGIAQKRRIRRDVDFYRMTYGFREPFKVGTVQEHLPRSRLEVLQFLPGTIIPCRVRCGPHGLAFVLVYALKHFVANLGISLTDTILIFCADPR